MMQRRDAHVLGRDMVEHVSQCRHLSLVYTRHVVHADALDFRMEAAGDHVASAEPLEFRFFGPPKRFDNTTTVCAVDGNDDEIGTEEKRVSGGAYPVAVVVDAIKERRHVTGLADAFDECRVALCGARKSAPGNIVVAGNDNDMRWFRKRRSEFGEQAWQFGEAFGAPTGSDVTGDDDPVKRFLGFGEPAGESLQRISQESNTGDPVLFRYGLDLVVADHVPHLVCSPDEDPRDARGVT